MDFNTHSLTVWLGFFLRRRKITRFLLEKFAKLRTLLFPEPYFIVKMAVHSENLTAGISIAVTNVLNMNYN